MSDENIGKENSCDKNKERDIIETGIPPKRKKRNLENRKDEAIWKSKAY